MNPDAPSRDERAARTRAAYEHTRERVLQLLAECTPAALATPVPACPQWTAQQVLAHLVHLAVDVAEGRGEPVPSPAWTAAQVAAGAGVAVPELAERWRTVTPALAPVFTRAAGAQLVMDAVDHEVDLRVALGLPVDADPDAVAVGLDFLARAFGGYVRGRSAAGPGLRAVTPQGEWLLAPPGEGQRVDDVRAPALDVLRALTGRRTPEQLRAMAWSPGAGEVWPREFAWAIFAPPTTAVD